MANFFKKNLKNIFLHMAIGVVIIMTCIVAALFAIKLENQQREELALAKTLKQQDFYAHSHKAQVSTPFPLERDSDFTIDPDIRYYVKDNVAFYGKNEEISLLIYAVTYNTELFNDDWQPNIENMAQVSMKTLDKNFLLSNLKHESKYLTIRGKKVVSLTSTYRKDDKNYVQKVIHYPTPTCSWSFRAIYEDNKKNAKLVDLVFKSISVVPLKWSEEDER